MRQLIEPQVSILAMKRNLFGNTEPDYVSVSVTEGSTLTIRTVHPQSPARVSEDHALLVPASLSAVTIETSNGAVRVEGVSATVSAQTSNGAVRLMDAGSDVTARMSHRAVTIENASVLGNLDTSNDRLDAEVWSARSDELLRTSNGNVDLAFAPGRNTETSADRISLPDGLLQLREQAETRLRALAGMGGVRSRSGRRTAASGSRRPAEGPMPFRLRIPFDATPRAGPLPSLHGEPGRIGYEGAPQGAIETGCAAVRGRMPSDDAGHEGDAHNIIHFSRISEIERATSLVCGPQLRNVYP